MASEILYTGKQLRKHLGRNVLRRKKANHDTIKKVLDFFEDSDYRLEFSYCSKYGEPGYTDPEALILFGNWNYTDSELGDLLEGLGFELEWCDEWTEVDDFAYRTQPNGYGWQSQIHACDGYYLTPQNDVSEWIEEMHGDATMALPSWIEEAQLTALGWERIDEKYEHGFHPGQTDDPKKIAAKLEKDSTVDDFIFRITGAGQFDISFEVYVMRLVECTSCGGTGEGICKGDECSCCKGEKVVRNDHPASGSGIGN